jgi:hypothetical protein
MAALLAVASPVLAQPTPPAPPAAPVPPQPQMAFANVSPEGRALLRQAMAAGQQDRAALRASRDRVNALIAADRLDVAALGKAMAEERAIVDRQQSARQSALLAALQQMSTADRKAFAADAQRGRERAERRIMRWQGGNGAPPPPPPPPSAQ